MNAPKILNKNDYKQIVFNVGKVTQDTLWATAADSLVLNGIYKDSSNKTVEKVFYNNGKLKSKNLVKYSDGIQKNIP